MAEVMQEQLSALSLIGQEPDPKDEDARDARILQTMSPSSPAYNEAMARIAAKYRPRMDAILLRGGMMDINDRNDVVQSVFLQIWSKIHELRDGRLLDSWIGTTTHRLGINARVRRRLQVSVSNYLPDGEQLTPLDKLIKAERITFLREAGALLKDLDRETMDDQLEELSLIEAGDRRGVPVGTIKRRRHSVRKRLWQKIEETRPGYFEEHDEERPGKE